MENTVIVDVTSVLPTQLKRTVGECQVLCPKCSGIGLVSDGKYVSPCRDCYGQCVVNLCKHCNEPKFSMHECQGTRDERMRNQVQKDQEKWSKAEKISLSEACERYEMVVVEPDTYLPPDEVSEYVADMYSDEDSVFHTPYVWGTTSTNVVLNADDILESATSDLHEEAYERISKRDTDELQEFLEQWCQRESVRNATTTYYPDYRIAVEVTKEDLQGED